jgi:hypothetical protein
MDVFPEAAMHDAELVILRTFANRFEADLAKSALDAADIESLIRADDVGGMRPHMWVSSGVELLVRREDAVRSAEILDSVALPDSPQ